MNPPPGRSAPTALLAASLLASALTACTSSTTADQVTVDYEPGTVVRVIDGDTLVINFDGSDQTVRLLNVDTPETKHPDKPVECLGPEATEKLEALVPPGTEVALDFDVERTDQYDRILAAVFLENLTLVNAELARTGLGVPLLIEPNRKYYDDVEAAYSEAVVQQIGLLDPAAECTMAATTEEAIEALTAATAAPVGETPDAATAAVAGIVTAMASAKAARAVLEAGKQTVGVIALGVGAASSAVQNLDTHIARAERSLTAASAKVTTITEAAAAAEKATAEKATAEKAAAEKAAAVDKARAEAEAAAAEAAQADAARIQQETDARAEAEAIAANAAAAAEQERIRNLPAPEPYLPPAPPVAPPAAPVVPPAAPVAPPAAPVAPPAPPAAQDPYPGYTGPRCYAPGGKTWQPC